MKEGKGVLLHISAIVCIVNVVWCKQEVVEVKGQCQGVAQGGGKGQTFNECAESIHKKHRNESKAAEWLQDGIK